jgi:hypothetical protein
MIGTEHPEWHILRMFDLEYFGYLTSQAEQTESSLASFTSRRLGLGNARFGFNRRITDDQACTQFSCLFL